MRLAIITKEDLASLMKFGHVFIPRRNSVLIAENQSEEQSLLELLQGCNLITYPEQYLLVKTAGNSDDELVIEDIQEIIASNSQGYNDLKNQFRRDLKITQPIYEHIFRNYLEGPYRYNQILNGVLAFRTLCEVPIEGDFSGIIDSIVKGYQYRVTYHQHYKMSPECFQDPYAAMVAYERHAPYSLGRIGYFCDVVELFCYIKKPNLGYRDSVIEGTSIYKTLTSIPKDAKTAEIVDLIKDQGFVAQCNEIFTLPGGYLVPVIFFWLRERFRDKETFLENKAFIDSIKASYPEEFDIACSFVGGFFGYEHFYEEYYSKLNLPILFTFSIPKVEVPELVVEPKPVAEERSEGDTDADEAAKVFNTIQAAFEALPNKPPRYMKAVLKLASDNQRVLALGDLLLQFMDTSQQIKDLLELKQFSKKDISFVKEKYTQLINGE